MASLGDAHSIGGPLPTKTAGTAMLSRIDGSLHSKNNGMNFILK